MTSVVVFGDSIAGGATSDGGVLAATNPFAIMAARLGWTILHTYGIGGSGYLRDSTPGVTNNHYRVTFDANVDAIVAWNPDIVMLEGSSNDLPGYGGAGWTAAEIAAEAALLRARIAETLPGSAVYMTAPFFRVTNMALALYTDLIAAMRAIPNVLYLAHSIEDDWINDGNRSVYLGPATNEVHPSVAGQPYLGTRLTFAISPPATGLDY